MLLAFPVHGALAAPASFAPAVSYGASLARGVDTGDLNGDGKLDVVAVGSGTTIRLGDGAGGLGTATSHPAGGSKLRLEDLNGDSNLDLAVGRAASSPVVSVALGTGLGTFGTVANYGPSSFDTESIASGDVDGDGDIDLAVNGPGNSASVILGTGTGAFGPAASYPTGSLPKAVALGHLDADGHLDLAVANANAHTVSVMRGTGTGGFAPATSHAVGLTPRHVAIGDLDQDGNGDLAVANSSSNTVSILLGSGLGFATASAVPVGQAPRAAVIKDLNVDGRPDIAVANVGGGVSVATGTGGGTFASAVTYPAGTTPWDVTAADLNADGRPDLIVANEGTQNVTVHLNTTDIRPPETTIASGPSGLTNDPKPVFTFEADEPAAFECSLDQGTPAYTACASGDTFAMSADGDYTFRVRATDSVGNVEATPATRELTLDTTDPETTITSGPSGLTADATPAFEFESDEPGTFECSLDQGTASYAPCASGDTFPVVDGTYTFRVRATDTSGNVDPTPATREFTLDTVEPETTITSGPSGPTNDATPTFEFQSNEPGTFECSLDQGTTTYTACASGDTFSIATDGDYTFRVRATDEAGNTDATPATRDLTLDRTPAPVFEFTGFFQPVDNLPTLNLTSPGQGVAIKFSLGGEQGLDVLAAGYPKSEQIACDPSVEIDGIESTTSAGSGGLEYDLETDTYTYVWKTQRNWAGTCRQLVLKFTDGESHRATFKFRR